jgi:multicomponent Na+:H+ antiporter subunit E
MTAIATRAVQVTALSAIFLKELVVSSVAVARSVLGAKDASSPAIIAVPIGLRTAAGVTTLANCVSLTPGTTSLHVSEDMATLYIHVLDAPSADVVIASIKATFEARIKEIEG